MLREDILSHVLLMADRDVFSLMLTRLLTMKLTDITEQKSEDKMKYKITFEDEQLTCLAEAGTTVLEAQIAAGMTPDAFCGGNGKCGKCKVVIDEKKCWHVRRQ